MGAFGEKLRKQREQRGITLDAISSTTKIGTRMLRALEDEHFDQLPGGVFNKGFVRAYARQVGLNEEDAVTDYLAALRESQMQQQSILPDFRSPAAKPSQIEEPELAGPELRNPELRNPGLRSRDLPGYKLSGNDDNDHPPQGEDRRKQGRRNEDLRHEDRREDVSPVPDSASHASASNTPAERSSNRYPAGNPVPPASARIPWGQLALALLLVTLALAFWNFRRHAGPQAASQPVASPLQSSAQASDSASAPAPAAYSASAKSPVVGKPSPSGTLSAGSLSAETNSPQTTTARPSRANTNSATPSLPNSSASGSSKAVALPAASTTASATNKPAANPASATSNPPLTNVTTPAAAAKPPSTFTLLIRAEKTTWVSILADGKPVAEETLIAPAHTYVRASHEIVVRAGNAAGISFLLNGKEFPAQGNEGEVKTYIFDTTGVRVEPQSQTPVPIR